MPRQKLSPKKLLARQREKQAFDLRLAGATFADIAGQLGYEWASNARRAVIRYLKRLGPPPEAEEMRHIQVQRLHRLLLAAWQLATGPRPDWRAQQQIVNILKEISALLGLYPPKQVAADITVRHEDPLEGATIDQIYEIVETARKLEHYAPEDLEWMAGIQQQLDGAENGPDEEGPGGDVGEGAGN